ncbi:MAG: peptidylprolyl isomerase [Pirellulaceae bacterium]|nr:peptidylprolyl isomerase [Pirellulaceae bacterium]
MRIAKNTVVAIDYTLRDDDGQVLDSSEGDEPLFYLHGSGSIIPGLERELDGKQVGDSLEVCVGPEDGYGERNEALRQEVPRDQFDDVEDLDVGMQFRVNSDVGPMVITVVDIADDIVTVDGNHPLAGLTLNFAVTVREVRVATDEEVAHGHVHGPGGHDH